MTWLPWLPWLLATMLTAVFLILIHLDYRGATIIPQVSPDGAQYLSMMNGATPPLPYAYRWLLPWLLPKLWGMQAMRWQLFSWACMIGLGPAVYWMADGLPVEQRLFAVALAVGLPGAFRLNVIRPVLVDPCVQLLVVVGAAASMHGRLWLALVLALVAGACRETAPVFMALSAWSPWPLVGVVPVGIRHLQVRRRPTKLVDRGNFTDEGKDALGSPKKLIDTRIGKWLDGRTMLLPWGMALLALLNPSWPAAASVLVAYAQLPLAADTIRLYQAGYPRVVLAACQAPVPARWLPALVLAHLLHPWAYLRIL